MTTYRISGGTVLSPLGLAAADVVVDGQTIASVEPPGDAKGDLDASGLIVAPGFVDTHVHGALGRNFMMGDADALDVIGGFLVRHGVTSALMATASLPRDEFGRAVTPLADLVARTPSGLDVLGIHLEGPFLSDDYRGVHRADAVRAPAPDEIDSLVDALGDALRVVTLAPERPGALDAVARLVEAGVTVSIGHSGADAPTVRRAVSLGVTRATHLYNAVPERTGDSFVDVLMDSPGVFLELIADGYHVAPDLIARTFSEAGAPRIMIVSDESDVTGLGDGPHRRWEGTDVVVRDGQSRTPAGTLAGSVCPLDGALRILVRSAGIDIATALRSLSENPARSIGATTKGRIATGADADLVLIDEATLSIRATMAGGRLVHHDRVDA